MKYGIPFINGAFLKPGDKVDVSQVFRYHSMNAEQKYRPAWHRSPDQLNGIILSLWWKNDEIGLKKIVENLEKEEEFQSMSAWIGGSGGIPLKPGSYPVSDLSNIDRHEVQSVGTLESPQNIQIPSPCLRLRFEVPFFLCMCLMMTRNLVCFNT